MGLIYALYVDTVGGFLFCSVQVRIIFWKGRLLWTDYHLSQEELFIVEFTASILNPSLDTEIRGMLVFWYIYAEVLGKLWT
jgi:hypothetical protein